MSIRVVLADDHTLVRAGLRALLDTLPGIEVLGEASNGREAVELAMRLHPDIVLMDIAMPELNGLDAAERIRQDAPGTRVVIISMLGTEEYVAQALQRGVTGYLLKDAEGVELELALKAVARGETYLSPAAASQARVMAMRGAPADAGKLTSRQREILQLVVEGYGTKEIAQKLDLSVRTVETHRTQVMDRLGIRDIPGLVRYAIRAGLIPAETPDSRSQ